MCPYEKELIDQNVDALFTLFSVKVPAEKAELAKKFITDFVESIIPNLCDYLYEVRKLSVEKLFEEVANEVGCIYLVLENELLDCFNASKPFFFVFATNEQILDNIFEHPPLPAKHNVSQILEEFIFTFKKNSIISVGLTIYNDVNKEIQFGTLWANIKKDSSFNFALDPGFANVFLKKIKEETIKEYYIPYKMSGVDSTNNKASYVALSTPTGVGMGSFFLKK